MKITPDQIEARIVDTTYMRIDGTTVTICHITLDNGFSVRGESACIDPAEFKAETGNEMAYKDAFNKLWPLFGFMAMEDRYRDSCVGEIKIEEFRDGALVLSCGNDGMDSDLVFASGAMRGDPILDKQNQILRRIVDAMAINSEFLSAKSE